MKHPRAEAWRNVYTRRLAMDEAGSQGRESSEAYLSAQTLYAKAVEEAHLMEVLPHVPTAQALKEAQALDAARGLQSPCRYCLAPFAEGSSTGHWCAECGRKAGLAGLTPGPDAATAAFDAIAELCGVKEWDYPGQVVRDVARVVGKLRTADADVLILAKRVETTMAERDAALGQVEASGAHREKWERYERDHILPVFEIAKCLGLDLERTTLANPGKASTRIFAEVVADKLAEAVTAFDAIAHLCGKTEWRDPAEIVQWLIAERSPEGDRSSDGRSEMHHAAERSRQNHAASEQARHDRNRLKRMQTAQARMRAEEEKVTITLDVSVNLAREMASGLTGWSVIVPAAQAALDAREKGQ